MDYNDKIKELKEEIEILDLWLTVGAENDLFKDMSNKNSNSGGNESSGEPKNFNDVQNRLKELFNQLYSNDKPDIGYCETELSKINKFYHNMISSKSRCWRLRIVYALHIWLTLIALGLISTIFIPYIIPNYLIPLNSRLFFIHQDLTLDKIASYAYVGFIAGVIKGLYNISYETRFKVYRKSSDVEYYTGPFISAAFATIIVFAVIIGFVQPQLPQQQQLQQGQEQGQQQGQEQQPSYYILAFAAGLFWQESLRKLASIFGATQYKEASGKIKRLD